MMVILMYLPNIGESIHPHTAQDTMIGAISKVLLNKSHQRVILILDQRKNNDDTLYWYQPNKHGHIEKNEDEFLNMSLFQNSKSFLLPRLEDESIDIGVNKISNGLILSFHCFSANEIRVYLYFDGWSTRFFIEDIKYFLPCLVYYMTIS